MTDLNRSSGVALWRQIADGIRTGLADGMAGPDGRLPSEHDLAERFGVNRHTVRAAIAALVREGALKSERGRGTFVVDRPRLTYPIRQRTRFSAGFRGQAERLGSAFTASAVAPADARLAADLKVPVGAPLVRLSVVGLADGTPISRGTAWFEQARFPDIAERFRETSSITASLAACGVADYVRASTSIEAHHANADDIDLIRLSPGAIVLVAHAVNTEPDGTPCHVSVSRFAADRVALSVDHFAASGEV